MGDVYKRQGWDDLKSAADAIEALESELDRLRRERDQAVEELHRNTDAVPVVRCKDCKHEISTADIRARTGSYSCVIFFSLPYTSVLSAFSKNLDLFSSLSACRSIFSYSIRPLNSSSAS